MASPIIEQRLKVSMFPTTLIANLQLEMTAAVVKNVRQGHPKGSSKPVVLWYPFSLFLVRELYSLHIE